MIKVKVSWDPNGFSLKSIAKIDNAVYLLEQVINQPDFHEWILNYKRPRKHAKWYQFMWWKWKVEKETIKGFHHTLDSGRKVLGRIQMADESLDNDPDGIVDIYLRSYYTNKRVVGYTYPNTKWQWINRRVLRTFNSWDVAGNLIHEYMHKLGYTHEHKWTKDREYSVPYAIAYEVRRRAKLLAKGSV